MEKRHTYALTDIQVDIIKVAFRMTTAYGKEMVKRGSVTPEAYAQVKGSLDDILADMAEQRDIGLTTDDLATIAAELAATRRGGTL